MFSRGSCLLLIALLWGCPKKAPPKPQLPSRWARMAPAPIYSTGEALDSAALAERPFVQALIEALPEDSELLVTDRACDLSDHLLHRAGVAGSRFDVRAHLRKLQYLHALPTPPLNAKVELFDAQSPQTLKELQDTLLPVLGPNGWALFCVSSKKVGAKTRLAMVFVRLDLQVRSAPRALEANAVQTVAVLQPRGVDRALTLLWGSATSSKSAPFEDRGDAWTAQLTAPAEDSRLLLEIASSEAPFHERSLSLAAWVGALPPFSPPSVRTSTSVQSDLRRRYGGSYSRSEALDRLAAQSARDLSAGRIPRERVRSLSLRDRFGEVHLGWSPASEGLNVSTPFFRRAVDGATQLGAFRSTGASSWVVLALASPPPKISIAQAKASLIRSLGIEDRRAQDLESALQKEALQVCETLASAPKLAPQALRAINQRVRKGAPDYAGASAVQLLNLAPRALADAQSPLLDQAKYQSFAVGLCQGDFVRGPGRVAVLLMALEAKRPSEEATAK